jgi:iron complex outermembrane receptor protein
MRSLLSWEYRSERFSGTLKSAYLTERYRYYQFSGTDPDEGNAETALVRYEASVAFSRKSRLDGVVHYERTLGFGSNVGRQVRETASGALLWAQAFRKLHIELGIRQEITATYDSPLLFSAGLCYPIGKMLELKAGVSRNFRIPTFNDLYWSEGGNADLRPEDAMQYQAGIAFRSKSFEASANVYQIDIQDMIQWLPGTIALWLPQNVGRVRSYGGEAFADFHKDFGKTRISARGSYGYTVSENRATGKFLIYVPRNRATAALQASHGRISGGIHGSLTDEVFTRTDNNPRYNLDGYSVWDGDAQIRIGKTKNIAIGGQIRNIFDTRYAVVEGRPFPGRNYQLYINVTL